MKTAANRGGLIFGSGRNAWTRPGCETIGGIQIIRDGTLGSFSVRVTLYGKADKKIADRAINFVQREKRRHFYLIKAATLP
jgi:hypothetical protein